MNIVLIENVTSGIVSGLGTRGDDNVEELMANDINYKVNADVNFTVLLFNIPNVQTYACPYRSYRPTPYKPIIILLFQ